MGPQYTSCVEAKDFKPLDYGLVATLGIIIGVGGIAAFFTAGIGAVVAIGALVQLLRYILDWMLNGKLICLHRDPANGCNCGSDSNTVCAIGEIADTEQIGEDKNPVEDVDNDYAINLILFPFNIKLFTTNVKEKNHEIATAPNQPQGDLIRLQNGMPTKIKFQNGMPTKGEPIFEGYFRTMVHHRYSNPDEYYAWTELFGKNYGWFGIGAPNTGREYGDYIIKHPNAEKFEVPVLHCEFEGSRIRDMLNAIEAYSFGGSWCKKNWFYRLVCVVLQTIFAPFVLLAVAAAWAAARDGNPADALQGGGTISSKDKVIVRGRWAYDGGHSGYNEVHATRIVQKVYNVPQNPKEFEKFRQQWCDLMSEIPRIESPGLKLLTPAEQKTYDNQQKPENQWTLHPEVDGCTPDDRPVIR